MASYIRENVVIQSQWALSTKGVTNTQPILLLKTFFIHAVWLLPWKGCKWLGKKKGMEMLFGSVPLTVMLVYLILKYGFNNHVQV